MKEGVRVNLGARIDGEESKPLHDLLRFTHEQLTNPCVAGQMLIDCLEKNGYKNPLKQLAPVESVARVRSKWPTC